MRKLVICLGAGMALVLPFAALADDAAYCKALADAWRKTNSQSMGAEVPEAINQCNKGNTAAGIPVLEKALKDAKMALPPRS